MAITKKQILSCLLKAKEKIKNGWHKDSFFKDKDGNDTNMKNAVSFCSYGAIYASTNSPNICMACVLRLNNVVNCADGFVAFNDKSTTQKEDVLHAFDKAIKELE